MTRLGPEGFADRFSVSRETVDRLAAYAGLLERWQARINLVGPGTLGDLWNRHMLDSAQLLAHLRPGPVLDLGSGAGFPGLVLAILGAGPVHLVESDGRKCAFLREAARVTATPVTIHPVRAETLEPFPVATVTARALAPLSKLLDLAEPFLSRGADALFLKGRSSEVELTEAAKDWMMTIERIPSLSDAQGFILHLREVHRGRQ